MKEKRILTIINIVAVFVFAVGIVVGIGWLTDKELLKNLFIFNSPMKFNTMLCLVISSIALYFNKNKKISKLLSLILFSFSFIIFLQYLLDLNFGIDQLIFKDHYSISRNLNYPGRVSPTTSFLFIIISVVLFFINSKSKPIILGVQAILNCVTLISFCIIVFHLYGIPDNKKFNFIATITFQTSISLFLLSIGLSLVNPKTGLIKLFTKSNLGFYVNRRIFTLSVIIILIFGYIRLQLHYYQIINVELGISIFMVFFVTVSFIILWFTALHINKVEKKRSSIEDSYKKLNQELEQKIESRTKLLKYSMERMELATRSGQIGIWELEITSSKISGNEIFYNLLGISNAKQGIEIEALIINILDEDKIKLKTLFHNIIIGKNFEETVFKVKNKDHSIKYIKITKPYLSEKNLIFGALIDLTVQVQNEEQLKSRYNRVKQFIEHAPSALAMLDFDLNILAVSNQFLDDNQFKREEVLNVNINSVFEGIPISWLNHFEKALLGNTEKSESEEKVTYNGKTRWIKYVFAPWYINDNKIGGIIINIADNTTQVNAYNEIKEIKERFSLTTDAANIGIWDYSPLTRIMSVNEKMYEICNFNSNEFSFPIEKWIELLSIDNKEQTVEYIKNTMQDISKTEISFEYSIIKNTIKHTILSKGKIQRDNSQIPTRVYGINIDITDQKNYEKNLIDILNNTKTFIDQAPTALAMLDENLNYLAVSKQWYKDYKLPFENIVGFNHYDVFPELPKSWKEYISRCLNGEIIKGNDELFIRENGLAQWIDFTVSPWYGTNRKIGGIVIHSTDITEQKNIENELYKIQERLQLATETSKVAIWDWDLINDEIIIDDLMCSIHNLPKNNKKASSKTFLDNIHVDDLQDIKRRFRYFISDKQCDYIDLEYRIITNNQRIKYVWTKGKIKRGGNGNAFRAVGTSIDITFQKEQYLSLKESEEKYFKMVNEVQDYAIILTDNQGKIKSWNVGANKIFNYLPFEAVGKNINLIFSEEDKEENKPNAHLKEALEKGKVHFDNWLNRKDLGLFQAHTSITTLYSLNKKVIGFSILSQDLTERKRLEHAEKIEIKNKELEQITYITSHDLQEPLRTISSFVNFLRDDYEGKLDKDADTYIKYISNATERMRLLIKELMDYARLGKLNSLKIVDANQIFNEVLEDLQLMINETGALITKDNLPTLNVYEIEFRLLLQNLIGNALKFRNKNNTLKIHVSVEYKNNNWIFGVVDNGIGFNEKFKEKIFMMFQRLNNKNEFTGTGIGLAHCKKIVELHAGKIWAESTEGEGSKFFFTIPKN